MPIEKLMASGRHEAETIYYEPGFIDWSVLLASYTPGLSYGGPGPRKSLQLRPKFHSLFLHNSVDLKKSYI